MKLILIKWNPEDTAAGDMLALRDRLHEKGIDVIFVKVLGSDFHVFPLDNLEEGDKKNVSDLLEMASHPLVEYTR